MHPHYHHAGPEKRYPKGHHHTYFLSFNHCCTSGSSSVNQNPWSQSGFATTPLRAATSCDLLNGMAAPVGASQPSQLPQNCAHVLLFGANLLRIRAIAMNCVSASRVGSRLASGSFHRNLLPS